MFALYTQIFFLFLQRHSAGGLVYLDTDNLLPVYAHVLPKNGTSVKARRVRRGFILTFFERFGVIQKSKRKKKHPSRFSSCIFCTRVTDPVLNFHRCSSRFKRFPSLKKINYKELWCTCDVMRIVITYFWTGILILDHSYIVADLTQSEIAETKTLEPLKSWLLYQQFSNLLISQHDMSGPRLGALSNNRWSWGSEFNCYCWNISWNFDQELQMIDARKIWFMLHKTRYAPQIWISRASKSTEWRRVRRGWRVTLPSRHGAPGVVACLLLAFQWVPRALFELLVVSLTHLNRSWSFGHFTLKAALDFSWLSMTLVMMWTWS